MGVLFPAIVAIFLTVLVGALAAVFGSDSRDSFDECATDGSFGAAGPAR